MSGEARDEELFLKFLDGEKDMFAALVKRYERPLTNFIYRLLGNKAEAEDVFQETFLRVYEKGGRFKGERKFRPWLYKIALNLARSSLRKRHRRRRLENAAARDLAEVNFSSTHETERMETAAIIKKAVGRLPPRQKEVFVLYQYQGLSYQEIAQVLNRKLGTVKSQMHFALKNLKNSPDRLDVSSE